VRGFLSVHGLLSLQHPFPCAGTAWRAHPPVIRENYDAP